MELTDDERAYVQALMGRAGCGDALVRDGFEALVTAWGRFVAQCEVGWRGGYDAFVQELSLRTVLQRVLERLPPDLLARVRPAVRAVDYRYRAIAKRDDRFVLDARLAKRHDPDRHFWLYGLPEDMR